MPQGGAGKVRRPTALTHPENGDTGSQRGGNACRIGGGLRADYHRGGVSRRKLRVVPNRPTRAAIPGERFASSLGPCDRLRFERGDLLRRFAPSFAPFCFPGPVRGHQANPPRFLRGRNLRIRLPKRAQATSGLEQSAGQVAHFVGWSARRSVFACWTPLANCRRLIAAGGSACGLNAGPAQSKARSTDRSVPILWAGPVVGRLPGTGPETGLVPGQVVLAQNYLGAIGPGTGLIEGLQAFRHVTPCVPRQGV